MRSYSVYQTLNIIFCVVQAPNRNLELRLQICNGQWPRSLTFALASDSWCLALKAEAKSFQNLLRQLSLIYQLFEDNLTFLMVDLIAAMTCL